jgi:hypothetical protein
VQGRSKSVGAAPAFPWTSGDHHGTSPADPRRYLPRFFETEWDNGRPVLSEAGIKAIEEEHQRVNGAVSASGAEPSGTPTPVASSASSQVRV